MGLVVLNATLRFLLLDMERCDLSIMNKWNFVHKVLIICILPAWAWAAPVDTVREQQFINQQQRQQALENQLAPPSPDIHLSAEEINTDDGLFPWNNLALLFLRLFCRALKPYRIGFRSSARQIKQLGVVWEGRALIY
ncbi:polypeptide-transport-associated domain-containing protein ShlB-type [Klebsiella variicola]|nr:polypeptide-transport-associated domain-containing protein ShlB-type [Klebsiella variicola]